MGENSILHHRRLIERVGNGAARNTEPYLGKSNLGVAAANADPGELWKAEKRRQSSLLSLENRSTLLLAPPVKAYPGLSDKIHRSVWGVSSRQFLNELCKVWELKLGP